MEVRDLISGVTVLFDAIETDEFSYLVLESTGYNNERFIQVTMFKADKRCHNGKRLAKEANIRYNPQNTPQQAFSKLELSLARINQ